MKKITETAILAEIGTLPSLSSLLSKTLEHANHSQWIAGRTHLYLILEGIMKISIHLFSLPHAIITLAATIILSAPPVHADVITDWNQHIAKATKGFDGTTGSGVTLNSNLSTRISAIAARAVFDAVNSINHFSSGYYYYHQSNAGIASTASGLTLNQNAKLFALLHSAVADARIAAFASKYEQKFWRPITALNAGTDGAVTNGYSDWHPLAATPSHPSNTSGHSATGAAAFEILRAFFGDKIRPDGGAVSLGTLPWLTGTNSGTGNITSRSVKTFSQVQLENGASRLYLGVHFGFDNLQGQLLGLAVANAIINSDDPAAANLTVRESPASLKRIRHTLLKSPELYGYYGRESHDQSGLDTIDFSHRRHHR